MVAPFIAAEAQPNPGNIVTRISSVHELVAHHSLFSRRQQRLAHGRGSRR
jgi:hypothetical protein